MDFRVAARIFAFAAHSNGSAATDVSAFRALWNLQRDLMEFTTGFDAFWRRAEVFTTGF